jgi:hypothetical protein
MEIFSSLETFVVSIVAGSLNACITCQKLNNFRKQMGNYYSSL